MKRYICYIISFFLLNISAHAQIFKTDPIFSDSVQVVKTVKADTLWNEYQPRTISMLPSGYEFEMTDDISGYLIFRMDNDYYKIHKDNVVFSRKNGNDVKNPLPEKIIKRHSPVSKFFFSLTPYILIFILISASTLAGMLGQKNSSIRNISLKAMPVALLAGSLLEIAAYMSVGSDMAWWCDDDIVGFWTSLIGVIPLVAVVLMQYYSIRIYSILLFGDQSYEKEENRKKISLRSMGWGIGILIPVLLAVMLIFSLIGFQGLFADILSLLVSAAVSSALIAKGVKDNIDTFGKRDGLMVSAFCFVYLTALIISAAFLVIVVVKIIIQIIIMIVLAALCMFAIETGSKDSPQKKVYYAEDGTQHNSIYSADRHNEKIRKE